MKSALPACVCLSWPPSIKWQHRSGQRLEGPHQDCVATLAVKYGCEVVSPLGTCLDPTWLTHCLVKCHSINNSAFPDGSGAVWLRVTSFGWQLFKYVHKFALICARKEFPSYRKQGSWDGCELMVTNAVFEVDLKSWVSYNQHAGN